MNKMKPGYTVIEGWDYTGKTSVAQKLAENVPNGIYVHSPRGVTDFSDTMYNVITEHLNDVDLNTMRGLQISMNIYNMNQINKLVDEGYHVFADRGILSTLCYQKMSMFELSEAWKGITLSSFYSVPQPDNLILLTATDDTVLKRASERSDKMDLWDEMVLDSLKPLRKSYIDKFESVYTVKTTKYVVPTDNITQQQVYLNVVQNLKNTENSY